MTSLCSFGLEPLSSWPGTWNQNQVYKGICEGSCPEVAQHLLLQKADCCTSRARWLRLKIHPEGECHGCLGSQTLWGKGPPVHQDEQRQQKVPILQDWFLWQHKILIPNAITILSNAESKIFGKGDFEGLTGSTQPWHTALDTWASLYRLSVLAADRSPPLPKHLSFSTLAVDLCLQLLTPDSPAVPDTWDLASWFLPVERETAFLEISEPRWRPPTCHSSF